MKSTKPNTSNTVVGGGIFWWLSLSADRFGWLKVPFDTVEKMMESRSSEMTLVEYGGLRWIVGELSHSGVDSRGGDKRWKFGDAWSLFSEVQTRGQLRGHGQLRWSIAACPVACCWVLRLDCLLDEFFLGF